METVQKEKYVPRFIKIGGQVGGLRPVVRDGNADMDSADPVTGTSTYKVKCDESKHAGVIAAILFGCVCGYVRRVTKSEKNFRCEVHTEYPRKKCSIYWSKQLVESGEFDDESGNPIMIDETEEVMQEWTNPETGKRGKRKVKVPKIRGELSGDVKARAKRERLAKGETGYDQPQEVIGGRPKLEAALLEQDEKLRARIKESGNQGATGAAV